MVLIAALRTTCAIAMHRRQVRRVSALLGAVALASALTTTSVQADPCRKPLTSTPPNCQVQVQAGISYTGWETKGWAYYCSGDHPHYWFLHVDGNNSCFSIAENQLAEGIPPTKFSATITNWCFKKETLVISLACSDQVQPYPCANSLAPGCPSGPAHKPSP